jgi:Sec-independent protein translocase protein TatA
MGGFSIWHWIILLAVFLIPAGIIAAVLSILRRRKK